MSIDPLSSVPWATPISTHRRRTSVLSKVRPKSAMVGSYSERPPPFDLMANEWPLVGGQRFKTDDDIHPHSLESPFDYSKPLPVLPDLEPRLRSAKTFSSTLLPDVRGLARRLSNSLRIGGSKSGKNNTREQLKKQLLSPEGSASPHHGKSEFGSRSKGSGWFRSPASLRNRHARPSLDLLSPTPQNFTRTNTYPPPLFPIPGHGSEPPVLPTESSGSAARASAAAQNEILAVAQFSISKTDARAMDNRLPRDSESGIDIDMRDRGNGTGGEDVAIIRRDPMQYLPPELATQILAFLDSKSVLTAGKVSRIWDEIASSRHVWKEVFLREYAKKAPLPNTSGSIKPAAGLGRIRPDQDWKQMFLVRRALDLRWEQGKAAAIYLDGHKDSVYCVQFDEHKIVTGSRDQTIRIWDAHTFTCIKVIGAPSLMTSNRTSTPVTNPGPYASTNQHHYHVQGPGQLPFTSISPGLSRQGSSDIAPRRASSSDYHQASILCLQFDEEIMVTGSSDHTCIVWDVKNDYTPIRRLRGHRAGVLDVCFDHRYIVSCSKDTFLCVWDRKTGELLKKLTGHRGPVNAVQLRGDLVVSASGDGIAKLWNLTSGLCVKEFPSKDRGLACVEFSEDGRTILAGGNDQVIYQFDANTGELVNELKGHKNLVRSLHLDSSNGRVVSGSYDMSVKVFDFETGNLIIDFPGWTSSWMLSAKSDYRRIVATSQDSRAVIMDFGYGLDGVQLLES